MNLFQEFFVTAMAALIFSCIIVKLVSAAVSNNGRVDKEKVVVEEAKITKGLVVRSRKSKKRVKFVEQEVVGNVDHVETQNPNIDGVEGFVEEKIEGVLRKGDDFKGEKVSENLDLIEHCGGEREVSDVHEDADVCSKIEVMEEKVEVRKIDELVVVKDKDIANALAVDEVKVGETEVIEVGGGLSKRDDEKTSKMVIDEDSDDDWEGIERSELEEEFVKAVNFVNRGNAKNSGMENLGSELMMQLYGLQKIAMEGPCHEPQPMALKVYARAKWNAWQKMGSMNQEVAMEQYIKLLSDHVPKWTHHSKDDCEVGSSETKMPRDPDPIPDSSNDACKDERTQEMNRAAEGVDFAGGEKDKE